MFEMYASAYTIKKTSHSSDCMTGESAIQLNILGQYR